MRQLLLSFLVIFTVSCSDDDDSTAIPDNNSVQQAIDAAYGKFTSEFAAGNGAGVAATYTTDGRLITPGSPPVVGRTNIGNFWNGFMAQTGINRVTLSTTLLDVIDVDNAIEEGNFQLFVGDTRVNFGTYIVTWRRVDGQWYLFQDIFNSNMM